MRNKLQKPFAKATALAMAAALMATSICPSGITNAKAKKPQLSKKSITVMVKKTKKVKLKNTKTIKKTKWSVKNKKTVKLTKRKKTSVTVRGLKAGKTTVTAQVTIKGKKKPLKLKLKVQVVKNITTTPEPSKNVTSSPSTSPVASSKPGTSPAASNTPGAVSSDAPGGTSQPTPPNGGTSEPTAPAGTVAIQVPGERTGIKQGETLALTASGADSVSWSVTGETGATIDATGKLTVSKDAGVGTELTVTAQAAGDSTTKATTKLTIVENQTPVLTDRNIQLNQASAKNPFGLTYRSDKAYSTVSDPERGDVIRFDASQGYTSNSYDVLAWMEVDPAWAGKTVTISAYLKYDPVPGVEKMNLVINERFKCSNPAYKYNADPDTWYYLTGTYTLPEKIYTNENQNRLYICRDTQHMPDGVNAVYYIDDLQFTIEKADIEGVTLTTAGNATELYQNHNLQCSAIVSGTGVPSQKVTYSIDPPVEGVSISDTGLLSVKNAAAGAKINVTATSVENPEKKGRKTITVLAQTIDTLTVTAEGKPDVIYQDTQLQFTADVTATGDPSKTVTWKIEGGTTGITLSQTGLLTVGAQAPDNTKLKITATSDFDKTKSDTYEITVKANKIKKVTVSAAGGQETIEPGTSLNLSAVADNEGTNASQDVTWSIVPSAIEGVTLTPNKNVCSLAVDNTVANGVSITVRATSVFDKTQYGDITITVKVVEVETFDFNKLKVEYFENFDRENTTLDTVKDDGVISWKVTEPSDPAFDVGYDSEIINLYSSGIHKIDKNLGLNERKSSGIKCFFGSKEDYFQLSIKNIENKEKTYTFSYLFRFFDIDADSDYIKDQMYDDTSFVKYQLPLKLVSINKEGEETLLKNNITIPFRCNRLPAANMEYYNISSTITVPANETVNIRLMLDGDLPTCVSSDHMKENASYADTPHPCDFLIDNVAISSGNLPVVSMKTGEQYPLNFNKLDGDIVQYYTNSYLSQYTHNDRETDCHRLDSMVATVDEKGVVTANSVGETACIAEITHANGDIERRQCIIHVEE